MPAFLHNITFYIFLCGNVFAQNQFRGKVLDGETNLPLAGASVYLNNTSLGTTTDDLGQFTLRNVITGEAVVSSVGYERLVYKVIAEEVGGRAHVFKLSPKPATLRDVLVLSGAARAKYLALFKANFLGITEEADRSSITNLNTLEFSAGYPKGTVLAFADTPLTIINRKLGYIISFDLVEFQVNERTGETSFYGFTRYTEMDEKKKYAKNRRDVYYGSSFHFMRSLINNDLEQQHFSAFAMRTDTLKVDSSKVGIGRPMTRVVDIAMKTSAQQLVKKDSLGEGFIANLPQRLMVDYNRDPANKYYLSRKVGFAGGLRTGARSYLQLLAVPIRIDKFGLLENPRNVGYSGFWAYEKAANMLPYNYSPDTN